MSTMTDGVGTGVTLKEYVQDILRSESELRKAQLESTERALALAKTEIDRRLHEMNNLRDQINMERGTFVDKTWFERLQKLTIDRMDILDNWKSTMEGKMQSRMVVFGVLVTIFNLIISAVAVFIALHRG